MGRRFGMRSGMAAVGVLAASAGLVSGCSSDSSSPGKPVARKGQSAQALLQEPPDALAAWSLVGRRIPRHGVGGDAPKAPRGLTCVRGCSLRANTPFHFL